MSSPQRQLGVDLFNATWRLIESRADDELMVHTAHASAYHWAVAAECMPENRARGEWLVSRVYVLTGRPDAALDHAQQCLGWCERGSLGDWDLAFAHEALARANAAAGDRAAAEHHVALARGVEIADADDREQLERDLATVTV